MLTIIGSRPVWGAWIEILVVVGRVSRSAGRAPYGARGLKSVGFEPVVYVLCSRAPYGARGLKSVGFEPVVYVLCVAPRMGRVD